MSENHRLILDPIDLTKIKTGDIQATVIRQTKGVCANCGDPIKVAIFKGERWCSDDCRKDLL